MADEKDTKKSNNDASQQKKKAQQNPDQVFEDIFEHIDVDEIEVDVATKNTKQTSSKKKTTSASPAKKVVTNKNNKGSMKKNSGSQQKVGKSTPAKITPIQKPSGDLDIKDITAYIESTKAKKKETTIEPVTKNGTKLVDIPQVYAVVPHAKGDHKVVFFREHMPEGLLDDTKQRTKGSIYTKKGMKIYDVHTDFKEHPTLRSSNGEALDIWIIDDPKDLEKQLTAIQGGKGGGTNFDEPLIVGAIPTNKKTHKITEEITKKEAVPTKISPTSQGEKNDTALSNKTTDIEKPKRKNSVSTKESMETKNAPAETKPRAAPTEKVKEEAKKPRAESVETKNGPTETKPRAAPTEKVKEEAKKPRAESVVATNAPAETKPRAAPTEEKKDEAKKEGPFTNAVDQMHEHDVDKGTFPDPINLDATAEKDTVQEIIKEPTPKEPTPKEPTPKEPTPKEPTPKEPTPKEPTPKEPTPKEPTPKEPTPKEPTPKEPTPKEPTPKEPTPKEPTPKEPTPKEPTPKEPTPKEPTPKEPTPKEPTPPTSEDKINIDSMFTTPDTETAPGIQDTKEHVISSHKHPADLDKIIDESNIDYPKSQVTSTFHTPPTEHHPTYQDDKNDKGAKHTQKTTKQKIWILLSMFFFIVILGILIWFIRFMFFSNATPQDEVIDIPGAIVDEQQNPNTIPEVITEDEALNGTPPAPTPPAPTPEPEEPKPELNDEVFTLPELSSKLEAQQREAQRLVKDAKFIGDKKAIMFATTAAIKANSLLSDIEDDSGVTATEIQEGAEKIDFYLQEANNLLN